MRWGAVLTGDSHVTNNRTSFRAITTEAPLDEKLYLAHTHTFVAADAIPADDRLLWRFKLMLARFLRAATSAVPLATRRKTSSRVVTLMP